MIEKTIRFKLQGGDYNTVLLGLYNTVLLTAITPLTFLKKFADLTAITPLTTTHKLVVASKVSSVRESET